MNTSLTRRHFNQLLLGGTAGCLTGCTMKAPLDVLIRGGMVVDGTGRPPFRADIGIRGQHIVALGMLSHASAERIVDAAGLLVVPGFIDIHTHTDIELLVDPQGESKLLQGVTTEVGGNCGSSVFPIASKEMENVRRRYAESYQLELSWDTAGGFMDALARSGPALNYATFTGHGALRSMVAGMENRPVSAEEMGMMKMWLQRSMEEGSFGLSTGLEYTPSCFGSTDELIDLCLTVAAMHGIYATHMRNEDDTVETALDEAINIARTAGVSLQVSHLKACNKSNWGKVENLLKQVDLASAMGVNIHADRYPYTAYGTGLSRFLPIEIMDGSVELILSRLRDPARELQLSEYLALRAERIGGWDRVVISQCSQSANKIYEGLSLTQCLAITGKSPFEFVRQLLIDENLDVSIVGFAMDESNLRKMLTHPLVMIGSDGNAIATKGPLSHGKPHPRYYGTFPRVLGRYVREEKWMDMATAIQKMTSMPADKLGLKQRGRLQSGHYADVVILNPDTIIDTATYSDPHQYATGIRDVFVNGRAAVQGGQPTGIKSGHVLRKGRP